jgi:hypothetical protein
MYMRHVLQHKERLDFVRTVQPASVSHVILRTYTDCFIN